MNVLLYQRKFSLTVLGNSVLSKTLSEMGVVVYGFPR